MLYTLRHQTGSVRGGPICIAGMSVHNVLDALPVGWRTGHTIALLPIYTAYSTAESQHACISAAGAAAGGWQLLGAVHAAAAAGAAGCWAHLIIHTPLLRVLQHVISLVDLLELVRVTACSRCSMLSDLGAPWCWAGGLPLAAPLSGCSFSASLRCAFFSSSAVASLGTPSSS